MKLILAGIDFSKSSHNAARYAAQLATKTNCGLLIFHTFDAPVIHSNSGLYFVSYSGLKESSEKKMNKFMATLQSEFPKLKISYFTTSGSFSQEIEVLLSKQNIRFVVMGMAVKDKISKLIYGSHSTDIAGKVNAPVIIVPEKFTSMAMNKLVLAVDNKASIPVRSKKEISSLMDALKARLDIVHVRTENEVISDKQKSELKIGVNIYPVTTILAKDLQDGLTTYTKENNCNLVLILSREHSFLYNLFNERNTSKIAFSSKVPVLAIHEND